MKYFIDTEFLEGTQKTLFGKTKPTIDLISIGIKCEEGREYYAISKDFNLKEAWNRWEQRMGEGDRNNIEPRQYWSRENVLKPIWEELKSKKNAKRIDFEGNSKDNYFSYNSLKYLISKYGKTNKQIAEEIIKFCTINENRGNGILEQVEGFKDTLNRTIEFYGYYCDYDWVVFCWLFGKMIDLPKGFPMYCIDLKQVLDEKANNINPHVFNVSYKSKFNPGFLNKLDWIMNNPKYPKQINEHNALSDSKWSYELYKFLQKL